jgi:hypothetical protein
MIGIFEDECMPALIGCLLLGRWMFILLFVFEDECMPALIVFLLLGRSNVK